MLIDLIREVKDRCSKIECDIYKQLPVVVSEDTILSNLESGLNYTLNDISKLVDLSPSRTSRIVDSLVKKGLLINESDSEDRRRSVIYLSETGIKIKNSILKSKQLCETKLESKFSKDEIKELEDALNKIVKLLD